MTTFFLHGLDSSSRGTKGRYFSQHFPDMVRPDFSGSLKERLAQFTALCPPEGCHLLIGSSFGGLMATCFAIDQPQRVAGLILLAPALNFPGFTPPPQPLTVKTLVVIGKEDTVTPPKLVVPMAKKTFADMELILADDDHMLHRTFEALDWRHLLQQP